jgi:hypothetical protein
MAWISAIFLGEPTGKMQPTQVEAIVKIFETEGATRIVQIDTGGSTDRQNPGKQSQTIQFGRESAKQLFDIFRDTYGFE